VKSQAAGNLERQLPRPIIHAGFLSYLLVCFAEPLAGVARWWGVILPSLAELSGVNETTLSRARHGSSKMEAIRAIDVAVAVGDRRCGDPAGLLAAQARCAISATTRTTFIVLLNLWTGDLYRSGRSSPADSK
jgi:hypothetical protein